MSGVAIVFPYYRTNSQTEMLFPPLGAASLTSQLHQLGVPSKIFDGTFSSSRRILEDLIAFQPDIVGIYSMISQTRNAFDLAKAIRSSCPESLIVAGGPMPTLYPGRYSRPFDAVFRGEVDLSFPLFCRDFVEERLSAATLDELPLNSYQGLFVNNDLLHLDNPPIHYAENVVRSFPLPDRTEFDHSAYQNAWLLKAGSKPASIMTSFGCPFDCEFCSRPVFGRLFRKRDLEAVFEEIDQLRRLGYDGLWIADDNFTLSLSHLEEFCGRAVRASIPWTCLSRASGINRETARRMSEAGCRRVYLGLESGDPTTLKLMDKGVTLEEGIHAVHEYRAAGIEVAAFFIVGYPGETPSSVEATFKLALTLPLDDISFNVPYPLPGSRLFERVSGVDETKDWSRENEVTFVFRSEFDEGWLRRRIGETLQAFADRKRPRPRS